jgi:chromosome segregation ATPase
VTDVTVTDGCEYSTHDYQEMVALLQDEVVRLEQELQAHAERSWATVSIDVPAGGLPVGPSAPDESVTTARGEVERLKTELSRRDETVTLLLDQLTLLEEAKAAGRAEWEQLTSWVSELEKRVEAQDQEALRELKARVGDQQRETDEWRTKAEQDRRGWEVERRVYEEEIARLHAGVAHARAAALAPQDRDGESGDAPGAEVEVVKAVEQENLRLRVAHEMVERTAAENSNALRSKLTEMQGECEELRHQLVQLDDERKRERLEFDTTVAELRTKLTEISLVQNEAPQVAEKPDRESEARDSELRIRALKQHLREIHEREETERRERSLKHRLSRLWSRTSPP